MALTEALRLVIDADTRGAVKGLEKVGATADKELKKGVTGADKFGASLTNVGVGMVATGALLVGGLAKAAKASEEARLNMLKLENSVANNSKLAGHSAQEFADLADAIQDKTAADADDIIGGQAVLAQMGLEADQIKELTPLVVDLARKKGIDLASAAAIAAKAVDGNSGALKKAQIAVDETAFATDSYKATVDALSGAVGGFAEEEGATFAGSLERMKNQLGDVVEGVGVGAVDAFSSMLNAVDPVIDKFNEMDPAMQGTIGKFATFGATGAIFAGVASTVIGKTIQMRDNFKSVGISLRNSEGGLTRWGKAAGALGVAGLAVGLVQMGRAMDGLHVKVGDLTAMFTNLDEANRKTLDEMLNLAQATGGLEEMVSQAADASVPAAERLVDYAEANGFAKGEVDDLRKIIDEKREADVQGAEDQAAYSAEMDAAAGSSEELTGELVEQKDALDDLLTATLAQFDANLGYRQSIDDVEGSLADLRTAQKDFGPDSEEYRDALFDAESALLAQADAALKLYEDQAAVNGVTLDGKQKTAIYKAELKKLADSLAPGSALRKQIEGYIAQLDGIPSRITTTVDVVRGEVVGSGPNRAKAQGGLIYADRGMFVPRGTDTVPAMLTPGEFVMRKSAVDRIGVPALSAMNSGQGGGAGGGGTQVIQLVVDGRVLAEAIRRQEKAKR